MRLLESKSDNEFSLIEFSGNSLPQYAILSHTWAADSEEVTFRDLTEGSGNAKTGYEKLRFCARLAARDGLRYFWVDTCCIDKSSSAELSEAINSMFRWYSDAVKCYVFLSDVSIRDDVLSAFRKCRWFTRCWTLQELIAPTSVEFYSANGERLGDKKSLEREIHEITGISVKALQGTPLFYFSVDERMSWAAGRDAKREEDKSYSLLGIFDIQMPLLYGERMTKASIRLHEEIDKSVKRRVNMLNSSNHENFDRVQEQPLGNVFWKVPRIVNNLFTGRSMVLERIKDAICTYIPEVKSFVITGMGGLGKSEICLRIAKDMRQEFWGVFWAEVSSPDIAKAEFIAIAKLLGKEVSSVEDACALLSNIKKPCLLILDNADDPTFDYHIYLPSGMQGSVIITSRVADCNQYSTIGWEALTGLDHEDSQALLLKAAHIPKGQWESSAEAAKDVVRLLESHTLALIQAGAYIARGHCKLHDYPKTFEQQRRRLMEFRPSQARSRYSDVFTTFEASAKVLTEDALQVLSIVSMMHATFLSIDIFESAWNGSQQAIHLKSERETEVGDISSWDISHPPYTANMSDCETGLDVLNEWHVSQLPAFIGAGDHQWDSYRLEEALYLLESLSLVIMSEQNGLRGISIHPLAHSWAKDRQKPETKTHSWIAAGSLITLSTRGSKSREGVEQHFQPHVQSYVDEKIESKIRCVLGRNTLALLWSCSWMLVQMRDDTRLERLLKELFREMNLDPTHVQPRLIPLYHILAHSHDYNGHSELAVDIMEQIVDIGVKEELAATDPNTLAAQHMLGMVYESNGQIMESIEILRHVVEIQATILAETHPNRLISQHELARVYIANNQIKEAIELLELVVKIEATIMAETNSSRLASQHMLAVAYHSDGRAKDAIGLLELVVKIETTTLAETNTDRLVSEHELAIAYTSNGQTKDAIQLLENIVRIEATILAETHRGRLASQHALALAYRADGRLEDAIELLKHVIEIESMTLHDSDLGRLEESKKILASMHDEFFNPPTL